MAVFNSALFNVAIERLNTPKTVKKKYVTSLPFTDIYFKSHPVSFFFVNNTLQGRVECWDTGGLQEFRQRLL